MWVHNLFQDINTFSNRVCRVSTFYHRSNWITWFVQIIKLLANWWPNHEDKINRFKDFFSFDCVRFIKLRSFFNVFWWDFAHCFYFQWLGKNAKLKNGILSFHQHKILPKGPYSAKPRHWIRNTNSISPPRSQQCVVRVEGGYIAWRDGRFRSNLR